MLAVSMASHVSAGSINLPPSEDRPSVEKLVDFFDTTVFGSEFEGLKPSTIVRKWKRPLRIVVREYGGIVSQSSSGRKIRQLELQTVSKAHLDMVQKHLNTLVQLTDLKTQDSQKSRWPANFIINFVPPLQLSNPHFADIGGGTLQRLAAQGGCYFLTWLDKKGSNMNKAVIVVNKARKRFKIDHCILEEMTQSLGLPNDSNPPWPSIFANSGTQPNLSWIDRVIIKTLYDPRMTPGIPRRRALEIARDIITEIYRKQR